MGMQALQLLWVPRAADAEVERRPVVGAGLSGGQLGADSALLSRCAGDALDDEEALAGFHIAQAAGLTRECLGRVGCDEPLLEPQLLRAENANLLCALREGVAGGEVAAQRLDVEERDETDHAHREPAQE